MRSETEIRQELERIVAVTRGSYEELAGAEAALRWVLGEIGDLEIAAPAVTPAEAGHQPPTGSGETQ